jgi:4-hydroxy-2-oxoglutarate aldolase
MIDKIIGIIPPMLTPFKQNAAVDYDAFARNIKRWNAFPLAGYLVLGSNSEAAYLTEEEKLLLIDATVKTAAKGKIIIAGTGLESTRETIRFTNKVAQHGAHAALVLTPSFYGDKMTDIALIRHFSAVSDASDIPILLYNVPKYTHVNLSVPAVLALSRMRNIIGMKDSKGDCAQLAEFKKAVHEDFHLIVGSASILYPAFTMGVRAGILALANCAPAQCIEIQRLHDAGEHQKAEELQKQMLPVNKAVTDTFGIAGLKYASTLMGYSGGYVRSPLTELAETDKFAVTAILKTAGLLQ